MGIHLRGNSSFSVLVTGNWRPETGDRRLETGNWKPKTEDRSLVMGGCELVAGSLETYKQAARPDTIANLDHLQKNMEGQMRKGQFISNNIF